MRKKKIGLIADFSKKKAVELAVKVKHWLEKKNYPVFVKSISDLTPSILKNTDFVVTFGGDGTVLRAANAVAPYNIPMARVNFGTTGYLCNIKPQKAFQALEKILGGKYRLETRTRIRAKILKGKCEFIDSFDAFNEVVVGSTPTKKTTWLKVVVVDRNKGRSRRRILRISGDGLIVATRGGSTGYCLSAGGPALLDLEDAFVVVASNSHFKSGFLPSYVKSFAVPSDTYFEITVLRGGSNLPCVEADSDDGRVRLLKEGERVMINKSEFKNLFIELSFEGRIK